jgi:hypothetical protein
MALGELASGSRVDDRDLRGPRSLAVALALILLALNTLDVVVTNALVEGLGATEVNPLMAPLVGAPWMVVLKVGIPIVVIGLATRVSSRRSATLLSIVVAVYVLVAAFGLEQVFYVYT